MELFFPAVIMDLGLDEGVWVRHGVFQELLSTSQCQCIIVVTGRSDHSVPGNQCDNVLVSGMPGSGSVTGVAVAGRESHGGA